MDDVQDAEGGSGVTEPKVKTIEEAVLLFWRSLGEQATEAARQEEGSGKDVKEEGEEEGGDDQGLSSRVWIDMMCHPCGSHVIRSLLTAFAGCVPSSSDRNGAPGASEADGERKMHANK